jgi:hypothetical protein
MLAYRRVINLQQVEVGLGMAAQVPSQRQKDVTCNTQGLNEKGKYARRRRDAREVDGAFALSFLSPLSSRPIKSMQIGMAGFER